MNDSHNPTDKPNIADVLSTIRHNVEQEVDRVVGATGAVDAGVPSADNLNDVLVMTEEIMNQDPDTIALAVEDMATEFGADTVVDASAIGPLPDQVDVTSFATSAVVHPAGMAAAQQAPTPAKTKVDLDLETPVEELEAELDQLLAQVKQEEAKKKSPSTVITAAEALTPDEDAKLAAARSASEQMMVELEQELREDAAANPAPEPSIDDLIAQVKQEMPPPATVSDVQFESVATESAPDPDAALLAAAGVSTDALMAAETVAPESKPMAEVVSDADVSAASASVESEPTAPDSVAQTVRIAPNPTQIVELPSIQDPTGGMQVAMPTAVLAEALRPLIQNWVAAHLPDLVERLVREELERLARQ